MNIGLFFGSFNPIHVGHLIIGNYILNEVEVEKVWLIVSPLNPFKDGSVLLHEQHRLDLVKYAVSDDPRIIPSDLEFQLPRPSFTSVTLEYLRRNFPEHKFTLIMGSDSFQDLPKWKKFEEIVANHKILIYRRPGFDVENKINADIQIVSAPLLDISSTEIRELVRDGKSIRYLVPEKVRERIDANHFYKK